MQLRKPEIVTQLQPGDSITSRAPTRIDLAGGTIDIWPLYLFLDRPVTVNLGINLFADAKIEIPHSSSTRRPRGEGQVILSSQDQGAELRLPWQALWQSIRDQNFDSLGVPPSLELHARLLLYFLEKKIGLDLPTSAKLADFDFALSTQAHSPAGAGLGGSSTLSIAIIGALARWISLITNTPELVPEEDGADYIEIVRDIETKVIQVPAGLQDYYGAMFGGLQSIRWGAGIHDRKYLPSTLIAELENRILLFYSGQSRNSGINNWTLFKGFIEKDTQTRQKFKKISLAAFQLENALLQGDWHGVGQAISDEWSVRKTLASGITTPEIDQAFLDAQNLIQSQMGSSLAEAGKVCGAAGGGCFFIYLASNSVTEREELRSRIQTLFTKKGLLPLAYRGVPSGLKVDVSHA